MKTAYYNFNPCTLIFLGILSIIIIGCDIGGFPEKEKGKATFYHIGNNGCIWNIHVDSRYMTLCDTAFIPECGDENGCVITLSLLPGSYHISYYSDVCIPYGRQFTFEVKPGECELVELQY
jgi:hypothetical protein